jgi:hypothetical protein
MTHLGGGNKGYFARDNFILCHEIDNIQKASEINLLHGIKIRNIKKSILYTEISMEQNI